MKKSLLLASLIAAMALAACGKKEEAVVDAASAPVEPTAEVAPVTTPDMAATTASEAASDAVEAASQAVEAASDAVEAASAAQ